MGALSSLASVGLNLALAQQAASRQSGDVNADRDRQIRAIRERDEEERRRSRQALRRQLGAQRARAGAAGVSGLGGSSEAVLRGLVEEVGAAESARETTSNRRIQDLQRTARRSRRSNLLDLAGGTARSSLGLLGRRSTNRLSLLDF